MFGYFSLDLLAELRYTRMNLTWFHLECTYSFARKRLQQMCMFVGWLNDFRESINLKHCHPGIHARRFFIFTTPNTSL